MNKQTQTAPSDFKQKTRTIGILANILFFIFLWFPFVSVNGQTIHSDHRFFIMGAAVVTLILRFRKSEKFVTAASIITVIICIVIYTEIYTGLRQIMVAYYSNSDMSVNILTCLLLAASSVLMIHPALLVKKS